MLLGQRRHLDGVVVDEGRLDELRLASLAENFVDEFALAHRAIHLHALRFGEGGELLLVHLGDVGAGEVLDGLEHGVAFPRALEVDDVVADLHLGGAVQREGDALDHLLHGLHHPVVVLVGHVELHLGEFGVVEAVHTLVAEVFGELIDAVEAAHDEFLQIQLVGDAQVERHVQRVVVSLEGTSRRAAVERLQNRGLHFEVTLLVQIVTHRVDQQRALDERVLDMGVHDEVDVTLTVALLGVLEGIIDYAVFLLDDGQRAHRLAEDGEFLDVDADLAGLRGEHETLHADDVADVQFLEHAVVHRLVLAGTDLVAFGIDLDFAHGILEHVEGDGTHNALTHNTSGDADLLEEAVVFRVFLQNLGGGGVHLVGGGRVGVNAQIKQILQFLSADNFLF